MKTAAVTPTPRATRSLGFRLVVLPAQTTPAEEVEVLRQVAEVLVRPRRATGKSGGSR